MAPKKDKKPRDLTSMGWTLADYGFTSSPTSVGALPTPNVVTNTTATLPATGSYDPVQTGLINQADQAQVKNYLNDQSMFEKGTQATKTMLSNLFDTEDEKETAVESVWDGFLTGFNWVTDKINQVSAAGLSGLPGGVQTLTWDEAGEVSVGQVAVANAAIAARQLEEGNVAAGAFGLLTGGPLMAAGGLISEDAIGSDFDITDAAQRKKAFEDDPLGKWSSGLTDAVFTVVADPLIVAGKGLKLSRIKWVDRPITSQKDHLRLQSELAADKVRIANNETEKLSPAGSFLNWVGATVDEIDEAGNVKLDAAGEVSKRRRRTVDDVYNHPVIQDAANRDELASLLYNARDFDTRELILRVAYGDVSAREALINRSAEFADAMGMANRKRLEVIAAYKPDQIQKVTSYYGRKVDDAQARLDLAVKTPGIDPKDIATLEARRDSAVDVMRSISNGTLRDPVANPVTKEEVAFAVKTFNNLVEDDKFLKKAIDDEYLNALAQNNKGFAVDNFFGRSIESSRQRRAEAITDSQGATIVSIWRSSEYTPIGKFGRTVRLWRWAGNETPAGYIVTNGINAQESYREIRANINSVGIYSGNARSVVIDGKEVQIGGRQRRAELLDRYMASVGSSTTDQSARVSAIDGIEQQIIKDIAMWHGMSPAAARALLGKTQSERSKLIENIRKEKYYADDDGKLAAAPYLDTHLQNGTYLINFRALEGAVGREAKTGNMKAINDMAAFGGQKLVTFYDIFNSVWRPSVLLRLGYTQRNVTEGLFRASAFTGSLAPLVYATKQGSFMPRNAYVKRAVAREYERIEKMMADAPNTPIGQLGGGRFVKWRATQKEAITARVAAEQQWLDEWKQKLSAMDPADPDAIVMQKNINLKESILQGLRNENDLLDQDVTALAMFRKQGAAKRRVFDGDYAVQDGAYLSRNAFGNPAYTDIAWANMSSANTVQATLSLRMNTQEHWFRSQMTRYNVEVTPDKGDEYFKGVAEMLKQFRASDVGKLVIDGKSKEYIATWLRTDPIGQDVAKFVNGKTFDTRDLDGSLGYVELLFTRLDELTPNPALKEILKTDAPLSKEFWKTVKSTLDTDDYRGMLKPAVGNMAELTGFKKLRDIVNQGVQNAFKVLGTLPEDAFVRAPFYGRRYQDTRAEIFKSLDSQYAGKTVPFEEYARAERMAHRRALKDTKKWLYTIDRRTNLGHYGEFILPFVSATQNSVTALGRLTWRDPSIIGVVTLLWQAPSRMGLEDENGNIVIPIPKNLIPDGIEEALGLDNMRNIKVDKGSLNVVFPESGFMFAPRPGPLFAVPASEIMKRGLFGMSVETPNVLTNFFGEEAAGQLWDNWRKYVFGEENGLSPETLSWDMFTPPAAAKLIQILQGESSSTSYAYMYGLQYRTEMAKILANDREMPADMAEFRDEIKNRTTGMFLLRFLGNMFAFTPPQYESKLQPLIDTLRKYERDYPGVGTQKFNDEFGNILLMLGDMSTAKNIAGTQANVSAVANARKYASIIEGVAPGLEQTGNLNVLGIILNDDANGLYDQSAYAWQKTTVIPGVNKTYREMQTPEQAFLESSRSAGWVKFISFMDDIDALLQQRGLDSYRAVGAKDLLEYKKLFVEKMKDNPLYKGWYDDYITYGSTRTLKSVELMEAALRDEQFRKDHSGDPVWESAYQYLELRRDVIQLVAESGKPFTNEVNEPIRDLWERKRQALVNGSTKWSAVANRYLNGDDNPTDPGTSLDSLFIASQPVERTE